MTAEATSVSSSRNERPIRVRAMGFKFDDSIPRHWFFGNAAATCVANGLNLLFPDGERFFIRAVKAHLDQIQDDPELVARCKAFFGQEGRHGHEHERYNRILEAQGYVVEEFLERFRRVMFQRIEPRFPPVMRLSVTAALEHFTATMAENGLRTELMLHHAHPVMADLLMWHAAEEIEHKSVAFDVLQKVDPRWSTRAIGLAIAVFGLGANWAAASRMLMEQEAALGTDMDAARKEAANSPVLAEERRNRNEMLRRAFFEYLQPDFHPDQNDNYHLARDYLASIGRLDG